MHCLAALCRRFAWIPGAAMSWMFLVATACAAEPQEGPKENSWVLAYILVLLGIALGLMVLLRPGKRNKELPERQE